MTRRKRFGSHAPLSHEERRILNRLVSQAASVGHIYPDMIVDLSDLSPEEKAAWVSLRRKGLIATVEAYHEHKRLFALTRKGAEAI